MVLATGPAQAQTAPSADLELYMDVNGVTRDDTPNYAVEYIGGTFKYTIRVTNHGPDDALNTLMEGNIVPWAATFTSAEPSVGSYVDSGGFGTWTIGTLAAGATATIFVYATATSTTNRLSNTANASSDIPDPNPPIASSFSFITVLPGSAPDVDLEVTKFVDDDTPNEGDTIVYSVKVFNQELEDATGVSDATNIEIRDDFPPQITYVSDDSGGSYDPATGIWDIALLPIRTGRTLQITGIVNSGTGGSTIKNTATVQSLDQNDPNPGNDTGVATIAVQEAAADLNVTKTVDNTNPAEGATILYTVIVQNGGPQNASGVEITDRLPAGVTYVSDDSGGAYNEGTGLWLIGDIANGLSTKLDITATVDAGTAGATIVNDAAVTALDQIDPNPDNDSDTADIIVAAADLSIAKTVDNPTPAERDTIVYTVHVTNSGPDSATGVEVTDELPTGVTWVSDDSGGTYNPATGVWAITNISHGATETLVITARVDVQTAGDRITNTATRTASDPIDPNPENDSDSADITVAGADLRIVKTVDNGTPGEGDRITYSLIVLNQGPDDTTGIVVTDELPTGVTWFSDDSGGDYNPGTGIWSIGTLDNGDNATLDITATVDAGTTGSTIYNDAAITASDVDDPDLDNNTAFVGIDVTGADLGVTKTVDDPSPSEGDTIVYTVTATNGGPDDATAVQVTDQLPTGVTWVSDDSGGDYAPVTGKWTVGSLSNGGTSTLRITAVVDIGTVGSIITNTATVTESDQNDPNPDNDSDSADIVVQGADLRIVKTVDVSEPGEGDTIVYSVIVINGGPDDTTGVEVTDQLPTGVTWVSDDSGGDYDLGTGIWAIGDLANSDVVVLEITATVDIGTTGSTITNDAAITASDQDDPDTGNNSAFAAIRVTGADLDVTKTVDNANPSEGDSIVYTVSVTNGGPDDTTAVQVTDQLPAGITWASDDSGGDYVPGTGIWSVGDLDNAATVTIHVTATVDAGTTGDTITNTATITASGQNDPNPDNDTDSADILIAGTDLGVVKTVDNPEPVEGETIVYTLIVANHGPDDATGVEVTDQLPSEVTWVSDDSGGDYVPGTGVWTIGDLTRGTLGLLHITATVNLGTGGAVIVNTATITALDQNDPNPDNDSDSAGSIVTGVDLAVTKTVDDANPSEGDSIVYSLTVTNGGPDDATGVAITDQLPTGVTWASDDSGGSYDPGTGVWSIGDLANANSTTIHVTATVDAGTTGDTITNTATVTALDQIDPNPDNDADSADIVIAGADLEIIKTVDSTTPIEGDTIVYTVIVANHGPDNATGVEVTDQLPSEVTWVSDDSGGNYDPDTGLWSVGDVDRGQLVLLNITATVNSGTTGTQIINTATITALDQNDPNPDNDTDSAGSVVTGADLTVTKSVDNPIPSEGDTIVYTVHVTNGGPGNTTGVEVTDQLPTGVTWVSDDSGDDYDAGTGLWSVGDLANADTATLHVTATVDTGTAGSTITNTAQVTASDQNDPDQDNNTDTATIRVAAADLELTKTVDTTRPHEGDDVVYTVIVINRGPDDTTGVEVTDQLPTGVTWVSDDSSGDYDPGAGVWTVGDLATGIFEVLNITASVDTGTVGDTIVNTATVTASDQVDPNPDNHTGTATITVAGADVGIGKTVDDPHPSVGDTVFYSVQVTNGGPDIATNITVTDQLPEGVTYVGDDSGGTYNPTTGSWDIPSLAIGATTTLQIGVTIDDGTAGTTITNTATITASDQDDPNPDNNTDTADVIVVGADLRVLKAVDDHTPSEGDSITYAIIVVNAGPDDATGIEITDQLPSGVTWVSDDSGGGYDPGTGIWTIPSLVHGDTEVLKIIATIDGGTVGSVIVNTATITAADQDDPNPDNNTDRTAIVVIGADLGLIKTVDDPTPNEGDTVVYSLLLTNGGPRDATGIEVTDQLPTGITYSSDDSGGAYDTATGIWTIPALERGDTATLQITVTVDIGTASATIENTATITAADQDDPNPDNNSDTAQVLVNDPVNQPPSPVEPDDEGNLVPVDHVAETIAVDETPSPLPIVDPEGDAWTVRIQSGVLPAGITMNDQGVFLGSTTETGTFNLTMETCDDRTPPACSTFTYTLTVEETLPATGIETVHIGLAGLIALLLGFLVLVITSRRRDDTVRVDLR